MRQPRASVPRGSKPAIRAAMRSQAQENRAFIQEIAMAIPYHEYRDRAKMQEHESALYLALSDRYESTSEEERLRMCRGVALDQIRASDLYLELYERVKAEADRIVAGRTESDADWLERAGKHAQRRIEREIVSGTKIRHVMAASREVMDRKMPKVVREKSEVKQVIVFSPDAAKALQKAYASAALPPASEIIDVTPE